MAGIYLHIPFCRQRCTYCDFYTRIAMHKTDLIVDAICHELTQRQNYLGAATVNTIYFGGGTPSVLTSQQFERIFDIISTYYILSNDAEVTLEANPDDLTEAYFGAIAHLPFNRISMGIQTFDDHHLQIIRRRHTALQAIESFYRARKAGFANISIDLMYGLPNQDALNWEQQLNQAIALDAEHVSVYGLTYEAGTALEKQRILGRMKPATDELAVEMHLKARTKLIESGYEAYEISNYAKTGFCSKHNSAYWDRTPYMGVGPSAHSFDGKSRRWNVSSIDAYLKAVSQGTNYFESESITPIDYFNELIMLGLRTNKGVAIEVLENAIMQSQRRLFESTIQKHIRLKNIIIENGYCKLTVGGQLLSNVVIEDLMLQTDQ